MQTFTYIVSDPEGIHARPAGLLVNEAKKYESEVVIRKGEKSADLKRILALMSLAIKNGEEITVEVTGGDEETAAEELKQFFEKHL